MMDYITIIGLCAAAGTTTAFIPQAIKTMKLRQTKELSLIMYIILNIGLFLWLIYGLYRNDISIILANGITLLFTLSILGMKIKFG